MESEITAILHPDARNPFDKLEFKIFGIMMPNGPEINYVAPMVSSRVVQWFRTFAENGVMAIAININSHGDALVLHRLFSLWKAGEKLSKVELFGKDPRISHAYGTVQLIDVKIDQVKPVTSKQTGETRYLVNCSSEYYGDSGTFEA